MYVQDSILLSGLPVKILQLQLQVIELLKERNDQVQAARVLPTRPQFYIGRSSF